MNRILDCTFFFKLEDGKTLEIISNKKDILDKFEFEKSLDNKEGDWLCKGHKFKYDMQDCEVTNVCTEIMNERSESFNCEIKIHIYFRFLSDL
jgi:hypothetical protein